MSYSTIRMLRNFQFVSTSTRLWRSVSSYQKELIRSGVGAGTANTNSGGLLHDLRDAMTPKAVLEIIRSSQKNMESEHIMQALRSIFSIQKVGNSDMSTKQILAHPMFEVLCRNLKYKAPTIELNDTIDALKVVTYVGADSKSNIVQVLLQILRYHINDLSPQQITFVDFLLNQMKSCPLVDGLRIAMPVVFDVQLIHKMDRNSLVQVADCLQYVSKKPVSDKTIEIICKSLLKSFSSQLVPSKIAKSVIWSICDMDENEFFQPLLEQSLEAFVTGIDHLSFQDVEITVSKLINKYSNRHRFYYNETLMDTFVKMLISSDKGFEYAIYTLKKYIKINHSNCALLDFLADTCVQNPDKLTTASASTVAIIVNGLAQTNYQPPYFNFLKDGIQETNSFKTAGAQDFAWTKLLASLVVLGIYKQDVFEKAKEFGYLDKPHKTNFYSDIVHFSVLHKAISTFQPKFLSYMPGEEVIKNVYHRLRIPTNHPLEGALKQALGGNNYVATGVRTELGHYIDHVVVMRRGGFPMALPENSTNLEEINTIVPEDGAVILILSLDEYHYTINNQLMMGTSSLFIKTLEAKGFGVVPISLSNWRALEDFEKIPYLMREIRLKAENCPQLINYVQ